MYLVKIMYTKAMDMIAHKQFISNGFNKLHLRISVLRLKFNLKAQSIQRKKSGCDSLFQR